MCAGAYRNRVGGFKLMRSMFWPAIIILAIFVYVALHGVTLPHFLDYNLFPKVGP